MPAGRDRRRGHLHPGVDVVLLHGGLDRGHGPIDVVRATRVARGPAWVVLTDDVDLTDEVITAGAHGCLAASSTPVQIGAAIRAAARGDVAEIDQPTTGPLVQRVRRRFRP